MALITKLMPTTLDSARTSNHDTRPMPVPDRVKEKIGAGEQALDPAYAPGLPDTNDTHDTPEPAGPAKKSRRSLIPTGHEGVLPAVLEQRGPEPLALGLGVPPRATARVGEGTPVTSRIAAGAVVDRLPGAATAGVTVAPGPGPAVQAQAARRQTTASDAATATVNAARGANGTVHGAANATAAVTEAAVTDTPVTNTPVTNTPVASSLVAGAAITTGPGGPRAWQAFAEHADDRTGADALPAMTTPPAATSLRGTDGERALHAAAAQGAPRALPEALALATAHGVRGSDAPPSGQFSYVFRWDGGRDVVTGTLAGTPPPGGAVESLVARELAGSARVLEVIAANPPLSSQVALQDNGSRHAGRDRHDDPHAATHDNEDDLA